MSAYPRAPPTPSRSAAITWATPGRLPQTVNSTREQSSAATSSAQHVPPNPWKNSPISLPCRNGQPQRRATGSWRCIPSAHGFRTTTRASSNRPQPDAATASAHPANPAVNSRPAIIPRQSSSAPMFALYATSRR